MYNLDYGMEPEEMKEFVEILIRIDNEFGRLINKFEERLGPAVVRDAKLTVYNYLTLYDQARSVGILYENTPAYWENMTVVDWLEWADGLDKARKELRKIMSFGWGKIIMKNLFPNGYKI